MQNKKRVLLGVVLVGIIVVSISFVSAGFWDKITGQAPRQVSLTVKGIPEIVFISDINGYSLGGDVPGIDRDLSDGVPIAMEFEFYVHHTRNTFDYLPGPSSIGPVAVDDTNALLTLVNQASPSIERKSSDGGVALSCSWDADLPGGCPAGSVAYVGKDCIRYTCTVAIKHYDNPSSVTNWDVKAMVKDIDGNEDSEAIPNKKPQPIRETYFNDNFKSQIMGGNFDFGDVEYNVQVEPQEILGEYPLKVNNTGNVDISTTTIQAYNVPDTLTGTELILASWFKADDVDACNGNALSDFPTSGVVEDTGLPIINPGTDASPEASSDLRLCLTIIDETITPQDYATTGPGGQDWDIGTS